MLSRFSRIWLCVTPWTIAHQTLLSMGFSRQEYWRPQIPTNAERPVSAWWLEGNRGRWRDWGQRTHTPQASLPPFLSLYYTQPEPVSGYNPNEALQSQAFLLMKGCVVLALARINHCQWVSLSLSTSLEPVFSNILWALSLPPRFPAGFLKGKQGKTSVLGGPDCSRYVWNKTWKLTGWSVRLGRHCRDG